MRAIVVICFLILFVLYVLEYTRVERDYDILQTPSTDLTYSLYQERYPIVIEDSGNVKRQLSWGYAYQYKNDQLTTGCPMTILSRYAVLSNMTGVSQYIQIFHPLTNISRNVRKKPQKTGPYALSAHGSQNHLTKEEGMVVVLYPQMQCIIPHKWTIVSSNEISIMHLADCIGTGLMIIQQGMTSI